MFDTWASYESTRAFVTSSFLWQRRGSDFQTAALAAWQPSNRPHITLRHLRAATIQSSRRHERPSISTGRTTPLSLAILPTRPIRVRPTQSERSGQRIDACERLSPPRSNSSRDDENHPISGRSPPAFLPRKFAKELGRAGAPERTAPHEQAGCVSNYCAQSSRAVAQIPAHAKPYCFNRIRQKYYVFVIL